MAKHGPLNTHKHFFLSGLEDTSLNVIVFKYCYCPDHLQKHGGYFVDVLGMLARGVVFGGLVELIFIGLDPG